MASNNNYYGYSHGGNLNQSYSAGGYGIPVQASYHGQQPVYPAPQPPVQYNAYGSRIQKFCDHHGMGNVQVSAAPGGGMPSYNTVGGASGGGGASYSAVGGPSSLAASKYSSHKTYFQPASDSSGTPAMSTGSQSGWQAASGGGASTSSAAASATPTTAIEPSGLDKALFNIATSYYGQKPSALGGSSTSWKKFKAKMPQDPSQWKYCEMCKVSCPGPQAYKLHLAGKGHKKKEQSANSTLAKPANPLANRNLAASRGYCQICDVVCSGTDTYDAHVRGIKHQKVLKLMNRLGKPIPEGSVTPTASKGTITTTTPVGTKKVYGTPRINFVGGTQLKTTGGGLMEEVRVGPSTSSDDTGDGGAMADDDDQPAGDDKAIGLEYIEESLNETGTAASFYCKLCDCNFTDRLAKIMHTKGRRHRLQYKKKVDPTLRVEVRVQHNYMDRMKRRVAAGEHWRKKELDAAYKLEAEELRYEKEVLRWKLQEATGRYDGCLQTPQMWQRQRIAAIQAVNQRQDLDLAVLDRYVSTKHSAVYPNEDDLQAVQTIVAACEKALKLVSDFITDGGVDTGMNIKVEKENGSSGPVGGVDATAGRAMKGVMRVGMLAKGLLLHEELNLDLVVICADKPTLTLLVAIKDNLPVQLATFTDAAKYTVSLTPDQCGIVVAQEAEPQTSCTIRLTSPAIKDEPTAEKPDSIDALDKQRCLESLADLRHAKWFQAKANSVHSCTMILRVMRDFIKRVPTWLPLTQWALELLVEKTLSSDTGNQYSPGAGFKRVFECVASGIFLTGSPGLYDPCEKDPTDVLDTLTPQQREDITNSAQHALRMIAMGQIHHVLGIDELPPPPIPSLTAGTKRPRVQSP